MATSNAPRAEPARRLVDHGEIDLTPPSDSDSEQALLGCVVLQSDVLDELAGVVRPEDFWCDEHATTWRVLLKMFDDRAKIDVISISAALRKAGKWEQVGGAAYLARLAQSVPNWHHASFYATRVRQEAIKRELLGAATDTVQDCAGGRFEPSECLERHEQRLLRITDREVQSLAIDSGQLMASAISLLEKRMAGDETTIACKSGLQSLDQLLGGFRAGQLIVVAARPGIGKSALALNVAESVSTDQDKTAILFSLEMSADEIGDRLLSSRSGVSAFHMRGGSISFEDRDSIVEAAGVLSRSKLHVVDDASVSVRKIGAHCRRLKRKGALALAIVDYVQLVEPADHRAPREQQVATIARSLKTLARELAIPIVCLAQLNRQAEQSRDNRPKLSHLRESGALEQDADVVIFIHREEMFRPEDETLRGQAELIVEKQRNGPRGVARVLWRKETMRFDDRVPERTGQFDQWNEQEEFA